MIPHYTRTYHYDPWSDHCWDVLSPLPKTSGGPSAKARRQVFRLTREARETVLRHPPF